MHRAPVRFPAAAPPRPLHIGASLRVGETVLLRRPNEWLDFKVELRAIDADLALIRIGDELERVPLVWLRRSGIIR
jgi:hypothetical protein